jgi:hypothetical protein
MRDYKMLAYEKLIVENHYVTGTWKQKIVIQEEQQEVSDNELWKNTSLETICQ